MSRRLTKLDLSQGHEQVVEWGGRIAREWNPWEVRYTLSEAGWIDLDRKESFGDLDRAHARIAEICTDALSGSLK